MFQLRGTPKNTIILSQTWFNDNNLCLTYGKVGPPLGGGRPLFSFETENNVPRAKTESSLHSFHISVWVGLEGDRTSGKMCDKKYNQHFILCQT